MHRIDHDTATNDNKFTGGNPSTAAPATIVTSDWLNAAQEEIANAIEGVGITLNKADNTQLLAALRALVPPGEIKAYSGAAAPAGYLMCHGQTVSRTTYADLFEIIGTTFGAGDGSTTFVVPDLRGEFIRGLDAGRGVDTGRTLGSSQADALKLHDHTLYRGMNQAVVLSSGADSTMGPNPGGDAELKTTETGGDETRPRNVALNYIIKT